ncbi:MAG TPA: cytochrome-c peroxidase [Gemmatimonadales bacterium]
MRKVPFILLCLAAGALSCAGADREAATVDRAQLGAFAPLPVVMVTTANPMSPARINLGRRLFYETLLSEDHQMSCNSCHDLQAYGVDGHRFSTGVKGQLGGRNAPSVYNAAAHVAQFWDGRAATIEEQAKGPILNPVEMGMPNSREVIKHLRADPTYVEMFKIAFPGERQPVTYDNVGRAIGAFERVLVTPSRWDRFLTGNDDALTDEEKVGLNVFMKAGCVACHNGATLGGANFQKAGVASAWPDQKDQGRVQVTKRPEDAMVFKVASLRNVEKTAPYFHDGAVNDLGEAVVWMGKYQLGRELTPKEVESIVAYLKALTGTIPENYIAKPAN